MTSPNVVVQPFLPMSGSPLENARRAVTNLHTAVDNFHTVATASTFPDDVFFEIVARARTVHIDSDVLEYDLKRKPVERAQMLTDIRKAYLDAIFTLVAPDDAVTVPNSANVKHYRDHIQSFLDELPVAY